jgi:drug/metabolite transporter (DMT)-like permease
MKIALPILLTFVTAIVVFWYSEYVRKYQSIFLPAVFGSLCFICIAIFAYTQEGPSAIAKFKQACLEPYIIPYLLLSIGSSVIWFFITKEHGAAYAGVFESAYIMILVVMNVLFKEEKFDPKFFIGAFLVICGTIIIQTR